MSVKIMGYVWDSDLPRDQKFIGLAYADFADHEGNSIFPSIPLIAYMTGYSERQVQRVTKELIACKVLIPVKESRYGTNEYRLDINALPKREKFRLQGRGRPSNNGDEMSPNSKNSSAEGSKNGDEMSPNSKNSKIENGDIFIENGDIFIENGDIAMSPDPSLDPSLDPSSNIGEASASPSASDLIRNPSVFKSLKGFEDKRLADQRSGKKVFDLSEFPEDVLVIIRRFCDLFQISPPKKLPNGKGGDFALWIADARLLEGACGEFGLQVLDQVFAEYQAETEKLGIPPFTVARPGALIKKARAKVGTLRLQEQKNTGSNDPDVIAAERRQAIAEAKRKAGLTSQPVPSV